jgi:hypothetical protein
MPRLFGRGATGVRIDSEIDFGQVDNDASGVRQHECAGLYRL